MENQIKWVDVSQAYYTTTHAGNTLYVQQKPPGERHGTFGR